METIEVEVKTLWMGMVAVRDRFVNQARGQGKVLVVFHGKERMTLKPKEIRDKIVRVSEKPFGDRFSRNSHYLYYFDWKPDYEQSKLLL